MRASFLPSYQAKAELSSTLKGCFSETHLLG